MLSHYYIKCYTDNINGLANTLRSDMYTMAGEKNTFWNI